MRNVLIALTAFLLFVSTASAAEVDGLKLHSTTTGTGTGTIVFVHGWTCDETSCAAQVARYRT